MKQIVVDYYARNWAKGLHNSFKRWSAIVLHRRAGKTSAILQHHQRAAVDDEWESARLRYLLPAISDKQVAELLKNRVYWHGMPIREQITLTGVWDYAKRMSSRIPGIYKNESKLLIEYPNGSKLQLIGLDDPDRKRGPALSGLSLDEYSQIAPNAFGEVLSKGLADHLGYCIFSGTIKGKDQLYQIYEHNKLDMDWFTLWQDIDESLRTEEGATILALKQALADDRKLVLSGVMTQGEFDQEWYLSHEAAIKGSFYADILRTIRANGQITRVPYDPSLPVDTDWDLGIDAMAIWFTQSTRAGEVRLIDYHEDIGGGIIECIKALEGHQPNPTGDVRIADANRRRIRYAYGSHWGPHDIETREISTGVSRRQTAHEHGLDFKVTERLPVDEGIEAVIRFLSRCYFDEVHCERGLDGLLHYCRTWQKTLNQFSAVPVHNWASHPSDAFRGLAVRHRVPVEPTKQQPLYPQRGNIRGTESGHPGSWMR